MDVTACVGTYGGDEWAALALERAIPSASSHGVPVIHCHRETLHEARNDALAKVETEYVCFLDADDELEPGYFETMEHARTMALVHKMTPRADLLAPAVRYVSGGGGQLRSPWMPQVAGHKHQCSASCLPEGNWLVIGTVARAELLREVGGFRDWPCYEDWDLWLRCYLHGPTLGVPWQSGVDRLEVLAVPDAIYRAHVRADSRNRGPSLEFRNRVHQDIVASCHPPCPSCSEKATVIGYDRHHGMDLIRCERCCAPFPAPGEVLTARPLA